MTWPSSMLTTRFAMEAMGHLPRPTSLRSKASLLHRYRWSRCVGRGSRKVADGIIERVKGEKSREGV